MSVSAFGVEHVDSVEKRFATPMLMAQRAAAQGGKHREATGALARTARKYKPKHAAVKPEEGISKLRHPRDTVAAAREMVSRPDPSRPEKVRGGIVRNARASTRNVTRVTNEAAQVAERVKRLVPTPKAAAAIGAASVAGLAAGNGVATYYGAKRGTKAAMKPKQGS